MKKTACKIAILIAVVLTFRSLNAHAHDLVLIPVGPSGLTLEFGHPGEYQVPDSDRLIHLNAWLIGGGNPVSILGGITKSIGGHTTLDIRSFTAGHAAALVWGEYDNGYWVTLPGDRHFNTSKLHMPNSIDSGAFYKFGKALLPAASASGAFDHKLGQRLEIVPTRDPFKSRPGGKLPVEVLYLGKPLPGIGVEIGDGLTKMREEEIPRYKTDIHGIALLPIRKAGLQIVAVDYRTAPRFPELSNHDDYGASLVFSIGNHAP